MRSGRDYGGGGAAVVELVEAAEPPSRTMDVARMAAELGL
jgi:hypothetical protein